MGVGEGRTDIPQGIVTIDLASPDDLARFQRIWDQAKRSVEAGRVDRGPDLWAFFIAGFWVLLGIAVAMIVSGVPSDRVLLVEAAALFLVFLGVRVHKGVKNG